MKFRKGEFVEKYSLWRLWLPKELRQQGKIKKFVLNCEICKIVKPTNQILRATMGQQLKTKRPFQRLYINLLGHYPRTKLGNTMVIVAIDQFTKYIFLTSLRKVNSSAIMKYVEENIFHQFGVPQVIHSGNGKQFVSSLHTQK